MHIAKVAGGGTLDYTQQDKLALPSRLGRIFYFNANDQQIRCTAISNLMTGCYGDFRMLQ